MVFYVEPSREVAYILRKYVRCFFGAHGGWPKLKLVYNSIVFPVQTALEARKRRKCEG